MHAGGLHTLVLLKHLSPETCCFLQASPISLLAETLMKVHEPCLDIYLEKLTTAKAASAPDERPREIIQWLSRVSSLQPNIQCRLCHLAVFSTKRLAPQQLCLVVVGLSANKITDGPAGHHPGLDICFWSWLSVWS